MATNIFWLNERWPGRLGLAARPRGGEWLRDELADWKRAEISAILSLLESKEESELGLHSKTEEAERHGLEFRSLPIPDRQVPQSEAKLTRTLEEVERILADGKNVLIHCRQGVGRTGLVAACMLIRKGLSPGAALDEISAARGARVPKQKGSETGLSISRPQSRNKQERFEEIPRA